MTSSVVIKLKSSDRNSDVPAGELVQKHCYDNLKSRITSDLEKVQSDVDGCKDNADFFDKYPPGSGLVYFIDGTRGAGKSTFLRAAFKGLPGTGKKEKSHLAPLAYIDPSRLEGNEIVLLSVLKALKETVDKHKPYLRNEPSYQAFRENFKKTAGGLSLFANEHHQLQHLDAELFLDHGLNRAGHSKDLRRHLHELLDDACKLFGAKALLLAIDDADTNSSHARKVLECIRNYLDSPKLITLVTGDLELYSLLVRDHFFDNLRHSQYDKDVARRKQRVRMVDHLEDQYLLKLFPIQRRSQLRPLGSLLEDEPDGYVLAHDNWSDKRKPLAVFDELIRRGLRIKNQADIALYREFLLQQPLRSVLQLLSNCAPYLDGTNDAWSAELSDALRESLRAMALGSLYKFGVDVDALAGKDLPALIDAVFELALQDGDFDTAAYLRPQTKDESLKNCFTALAAEVAGQCAANPAAAIRYLLGGPGSVSLFGKALGRKEKDIDRDTLRRQFRQYMGIGRSEDALNWARHATAVIAAEHKPNGTLIAFGVIGLNKNRPKTATVGENKNIFNGFDSFSNHFKKKDDLPVFALSLVNLSGSSSRASYASIFNILGLIGRILGAHEASDVLKKLYPPLSISRPEWGSGWSGPIDDDEDVVQGDTKETGKIEKSCGFSIALTEGINNWKSELTEKFGKLNPSSVMLGKVWTRLYFSLENASDALRPGNEYRAASIMEIFTLCLINAFLVEEIEHHLVTFSNYKGAINGTNPQTSTNDFFKKIKFLADNREVLPFTYAIATCPLILGMIESTEVAIEKFNMLFDGTALERTAKTRKLLCSASNWELIEKSFIAGRCKRFPSAA